jgi:hypothetical protein
VPQVFTKLDSTSAFVSNIGQPTVTSGALGVWAFEGTITSSNLVNAINAVNVTQNPSCGGQYSTNPANYKFLGIEDGMESWRNWGFFGTAEYNLDAWTAYY